MRYNILKPLSIAFLLLALTACEQSKPCIDADDFGLPKINLNAAGKNIQGAEERQVSEWVDSGLVLIDQKLLLSVYGRWYPWTPGGVDANQNTSNSGSNEGLTQSVVANHCTYVPMANAIDPSDSSCVRIPSKDWPCWLTRGMGVYGLALETQASRGNKEGGYAAIYNPNRTMRDMRQPSEGTTFHLGDSSVAGLPPTGTDPYERADDGTPMRQIYFDSISDKGGGYDGDISALGKNGARMYDRLYFKILDTFYADNAGSMVVKVRHGAANPDPGPIETLIKSIQTILNNSAKMVYSSLVGQNFETGAIENTAPMMAVRALLVLYIMFYAIYFVMGLASATTKDLVIRTFKVGVIVAVTSPQSFDFFTNHLFVLFTEGANEIINWICNAIIGTGRNGGDVTRMVFFDDMLYKFTAWETHAKIWSLIFDPSVDWGGVMHPPKIEAFVYIPIIYIAIFMFLIALAKCVLFYLIALIVVALLIAVAPIFIVLMLFEKTKELFEEWLKQLITSAMQPIIIMAFMSLLYVVIMQSLYDTVGYRACWDTWWTGEFWKESFIDIYPQGGFKFWMPNIRPDVWEYLWVPPFYNQTVNDVLIQASLETNSTDMLSALQTSAPDLYNSIMAQCGGRNSTLMYAVQDCRLVDYPSLDPDIYLDKLLRVTGGSTVTFLDILTFGIVIYLMLLFTDHVPAIARNLTGGRHAGNFEGAAGGAWGAISSIGGGALGIGARVTGASKITAAVRRAKHQYQDAANTGFGMVKPGGGPLNKIKDGIGNIKPIKAVNDKLDAASKHIDKYAKIGEKRIDKARHAMGGAIEKADGLIGGRDAPLGVGPLAPVKSALDTAYNAATLTPRAVNALHNKIKENKEKEKAEEEAKRKNGGAGAPGTGGTGASGSGGTPGTPGGTGASGSTGTPGTPSGSATPGTPGADNKGKPTPDDVARDAAVSKAKDDQRDKDDKARADAKAKDDKDRDDAKAKDEKDKSTADDKARADAKAKDDKDRDDAKAKDEKDRSAADAKSREDADAKAKADEDKAKADRAQSSSGPELVLDDQFKQGQQAQTPEKKGLSQHEKDRLSNELNFKRAELLKLERDPLSNSDPRLRSQINALKAEISVIKGQLD